MGIRYRKGGPLHRQPEVWPGPIGLAVSIEALPWLTHRLGEANGAALVSTFESLVGLFAEEAALRNAHQATVQIQALLTGDADRAQFFAQPIGTPSRLASALARVCEQLSRNVSSHSVTKSLLDRYFGRGSTLVEEVLGESLVPVCWYWRNVRARLLAVPQEVVAERTIGGKSILHELVGDADTQVPDLVRHALEQGADPNALTHGGESPLHVLLRTAGPSEQDLDMEKKKFDVPGLVRVLVEHGADVRLPRWDGRFSQHLAVCRQRFDPKLATTLEGAGLSWNVRDPFGRTPLHDAGSAEAVAFLVGQGLFVEEPSVQGVTPLGSAISASNCAAALALLERGAKPTVGDAFGVPLLFAVVEKWASLLQYGSKHGRFPEIFAGLVAAGAELNQVHSWPGAPGGESLEQAAERTTDSGDAWKKMMKKLGDLKSPKTPKTPKRGAKR